MQLKTPESYAQNRESQRRSRARRRELIDDLSRQLEEYKRRGIEASLHMQKAARAVLDENQRLRALLYQYGISPDDGNRRFSTSDCELVSRVAHKSGMAEETVAAEPRSTHDTSQSPAVTHDEPPLQHEVSLSLQSYRASADVEEQRALWMTSVVAPAPSTPPCSHGHGEADSQQDEKEQCQPPVYICHDIERTESCVDGLENGIFPPASECFCSPVPPTRSSYRTEALQTSCEAAAAILIDLQGQDDLVSARNALGCTGASSCSVKNTTIFRLMDEYK